MAESAARRDRVDPAAAPNWYLWEAPGKPAGVYLSFEVIDRLEQETLETFRSLTSRGSEMGGILLGSVVPGAPSAIYVEDYESIECDYSRGPLYPLSDADLRRFERALEERSSVGPGNVVGFFRSHTRKGLVLDAEDLQFLGARFRSPRSVALLIRPFATRASVGGIFLHGETGFNSEASALEFSFRSAQLVASKRGADVTSVTPAPARAQVVPIASRRETPPAPLATPTAPAIIVPSPQPPEEVVPVVDVAQPEPAATGPVVASDPVAPPAAQESREPEASQAAASALAPPSVAAAPAIEPRPLAPHEPQPPSFAPSDAPLLIQASPRSKVPILTGLLAVAVLVFVLLFIYPGFVNHRPEASPSASQDNSPLTLRVEHTGTDLLLTWNRESAAIRNATKAALSIADGDRHENYDMDRSQLQTGSIVYSPLGGDVSFQMEVTGKNGSHTATETLRVLRTRPSPMPEEAQQLKSDKAGSGSLTPSASGNPTSTTDVSNAAGDVAAGQEVVRPTTPVKPFDASSLVARLRPAQPAELADLPRPATVGAVAPNINTEGSLPFGSASPIPAPPIAAPQPPASGSAAQAAGNRSNPAVGGQIQQAQLISRREPEYPAVARQMGAKGLVELIATIGTDGNVKTVRVISGHPLLVKAAQDAVMHWRYRPTMLNGVPVQNETRITLNFIPQQ